MDNVTKLLHLAFAAMVFCIGAVCLFFETRTYSSSLAGVRELYKDDKEGYMQYNEKEIMIVPYSKLVAILMQPLEYDIMIDGKLIDKDSHTADQIYSYGIQQINYRKTYQYDAEGDVNLIVYTGMK